MPLLYFFSICRLKSLSSISIDSFISESRSSSRTPVYMSSSFTLSLSPRRYIIISIISSQLVCVAYSWNIAEYSAADFRYFRYWITLIATFTSLDGLNIRVISRVNLVKLSIHRLISILSSLSSASIYLFKNSLTYFCARPLIRVTAKVVYLASGIFSPWKARYNLTWIS